MRGIKRVTAIVNLIAATISISRCAEALTNGEFGQASFSGFLFVILMVAASVFWNGSKVQTRF
jgi:hypothetical protein